MIRYAVVGLGHIAQVAVLPAFANAKRNSRVTALVSGNRTKLQKVGEMYGVDALYSYDEYDTLLRSGEIDAVYIALPNDKHAEYAIRAARRGIHVLCEKPLAVTERECRAMIRAAEKHRVKLMTAYRLHFEEANLRAIQLLRAGKIGEPRIFNSVFTMDVSKPTDIRLAEERGGGTLYDIGVYCINAARYLFGDEPLEVSGVAAKSSQKRFAEVEESFVATLRFSGERIATFILSFGTSRVGRIQIVGTKGDLALDPGYDYAGEREMRLTIGKRTTTKRYKPVDQFGPQLLYFSDCIEKDRDPEPDGLEGLADIRIVEALYKSAQKGRPVKIKAIEKRTGPTVRQMIRRPPVVKPKEF